MARRLVQRARQQLQCCRQVASGAEPRMDMETPEMELISHQMRETMRAWLDHPDDDGLKARFSELQKRYQELFLQLTKGTSTF
jgi:hypothetical protein